jgi:RNA polymerase sigma-70 factor (ECF subfamily)
LLDVLPEQQRAVFVLFEIEQLTMQETVQALGCPVQTAYSRLYAARAKVQAAMKGAER